MRHLRVPSAQTSHWIRYCKSNGWYQTGHRVQQVEGESAIPLNEQAPDESHTAWEGNLMIELDSDIQKTRYYWEHIPNEIRVAFDDQFPQAFETQGDVLLIKIPDEMIEIEDEIAAAMLKQFPSVRIVCHDNGVEGEFRVRNLRVLGSRDNSTSTQTVYREHGHEFVIDPAVAYFSGRLSTQRMKSFEAISSFSERKNRPLIVVDPYAGVGPSMALPYTMPALISTAYLNDINPDAANLLKLNMERFQRNRKTDGTYVIDCMDARNLVDVRPEMQGCADVLLVNLPHDGIAHLSHLHRLLCHGISLICGWTIQEKQANIFGQLQTIIESTGRTMIEHHIEEVKGFSTAKAMFRYELVLSKENKR
jgi:tRNA G37 N-methylase Trm5